MHQITRRHFLAATAGASMLAPWSRVLGANEDIRVVVLGVNNIGRTHMLGFPKIPGVRVTGICDVDSAVLGKRAEEFSKIHGPLKTYDDLRHVFDDPDVDVVVIGMPNHWHGLATVWGCQAGKDVYVEKPCSHNIWEAGQMHKAATKYNRIVQVGIQRRSNPEWKEFFQKVHEGLLGKLNVVRAFYLSRRNSIGRPNGPLKPPATVNHNLWSGPASTELKRVKYHYDWHWFWNTGNGELGNNGPHILDLARWAVNGTTLPEKTLSIGGRYTWDDNGETPNTHLIRYEFDAAPVVFEITDLPTAKGKKDRRSFEGLSYGIVVEGEKGKFVGFDKGKLYDPDGKVIREFNKGSGPDGGRQHHRENFIKAVRSRKTSDLNCPIHDGHLSTALCHLGNISHRLGESVSFGQMKEQVKDSVPMREAAARMTRQLSANEVSLDTMTVQLGSRLTLDTKTEKFIKNPAANALLKREYRAPFIVPEQV